MRCVTCRIKPSRYGKGTGVGGDLAGDKGGDAPEAREIKPLGLVQRPIRHPGGQAAAPVSPGRVLLDLVVAEDDIESIATGMFPQAYRFLRRILTIVIQIHNVGPPCLPPPGQHRIVLSKIARMLDHHNRYPCFCHQLLADQPRRVPAAVIDQNDLMTSRHMKCLDRLDQRTDGIRAVIERYDERESRGGTGWVVGLVHR
jgi:hypothetical protein